MKDNTSNDQPIKYSKLLQLIFSLSLKDRNELESFAQMTRFRLKERDNIILRNLLKDVKSLAGKKENEIWSLLLDESEQKDIRKIKSRLFKAAEGYITYKMAAEDPLQYGYLRARYYANNGIVKNFQSVFREIFRKIDQTKRFNNSVYAFWMYEMQENFSKEIRRPSDNTPLLFSSLNNFYAIHKTRLLAEDINRSIIYGKKQETAKYLDTFNKLKNISNSEHLKVYQDVIHLLTESSNESYSSIQQYLAKYQKNLDTKIIQELSGYLLNHCIRKINHGYIEYADKYLEILTTLQQKGLEKESNRLSISRLQNLVSIALIADKPNLAKQFVNKFEEEANNDILLERKAFVDLYRSLIALSEGELKSAMDYALKFQSSSVYLKDIAHKLICDKVQIQIYFLKSESLMVKNIKSKIDTYLRKKNFPIDRLHKYLLFFNILIRLGRGEKIKLDQYKDQLLLYDFIWLKKLNLGS